MISGFITRRVDAFKAWWHAPPTRKDRILGMVVGAIGGFWIGVLAGMIFIDTPAPLLNLLLWAANGAGGGLACGLVFPKATTLICFPFSTFGGGSS